MNWKKILTGTAVFACAAALLTGCGGDKASAPDKGADKSNMGSWGAYVAYRHIGANVGLAPTFLTDQLTSVTTNGAKGIDLGLGYIPFKNVLMQAQYFNGKELKTDNKVQTLYGRVSFFF